MLKVTFRRLFADECRAYRKQLFGVTLFDRDAAARKCPYAVLGFTVIIASQLSGHRDRQQHQAAPLDRPAKRETRAECGDIRKPRDLVPRNRAVDDYLDTNRQRERDPLYPSVLFFCDSCFHWLISRIRPVCAESRKCAFNLLEILGFTGVSPVAIQAGRLYYKKTDITKIIPKKILHLALDILRENIEIAGSQRYRFINGRTRT